MQVTTLGRMVTPMTSSRFSYRRLCRRLTLYTFVWRLPATLYVSSGHVTAVTSLPSLSMTAKGPADWVLLRAGSSPLLCFISISMCADIYKLSVFNIALYHESIFQHNYKHLKMSLATVCFLHFHYFQFHWSCSTT